MSMVHKHDRLVSVRLFGKIYHWDVDSRLDLCSITSHCFVSNRHTGQPGCRRPAPQYVLRPGR